MTNHLYMQIPCNFENKVLTIKALNLKGSNESAEKAMLECVKHTPYYSDFKKAKLIYATHMYIELPFSQDLYNALLEIEPLPGTLVKTKQLKSFLEEPTAEEVMKLGY